MKRSNRDGRPCRVRRLRRSGAQTLTGTVSGRVVDQQGGVLPGVTVTLTGKTGTQTQVTDAQGEFRFLALNPGSTRSRRNSRASSPARSRTSKSVSAGRSMSSSRWPSAG